MPKETSWADCKALLENYEAEYNKLERNRFHAFLCSPGSRKTGCSYMVFFRDFGNDKKIIKQFITQRKAEKLANELNQVLVMNKL